MALFPATASPSGGHESRGRLWAGFPDTPHSIALSEHNPFSAIHFHTRALQRLPHDGARATFNRLYAAAIAINWLSSFVARDSILSSRVALATDIAGALHQLTPKYGVDAGNDKLELAT